MRSSQALSRQPTQAFVPARAPAPLSALFVPLERLLLTGGDARLKISGPDRTNPYGCRAFPRPEALAFASSTASTISDLAYARAEDARRELIEASLSLGIGEAFDRRLEAMRDELISWLGISGERPRVVFSPSGTDAQLQALFASCAVLGGSIVGIVVGADETGSGAQFTVGGRHFSDQTAHGASVTKDTEIAGLAIDPRCVIRIPFKDERGRLRTLSEIDSDVEAKVAEAVGRGHRVMLHAMDRSKFGRRGPSQECIAALTAKWTDRLQIVIDACQARLSGRRIAAYLARGYIVLITGSKFFSGPPFSGAMLVPQRVADALELAPVPRGLFDYFSASEWPRAWRTLRRQFSSQLNFGAWLRWEAALAEMRAYFAVPRETRQTILERFAATVTDRLSRSSVVTLLPEQEEDFSDRLDDEEFVHRTVFSFVPRIHGCALTRDSCVKIYRALNRDLSNEIHSFANAEERWLATRICHVGQPVPLQDADGAPTAALRISTSAHLVSSCWDGENGLLPEKLEEQLEGTDVTLRKLQLLLDRLPEIAKGP